MSEELKAIDVDGMRVSWLEAVANDQAEGFARHFVPDILSQLETAETVSAQFAADAVTLRKELEGLRELQIVDFKTPCLEWKAKAEVAESRLAALQAGAGDAEVKEALRVADVCVKWEEVPGALTKVESGAFRVLARAYRAAQARIAELEDRYRHTHEAKWITRGDEDFLTEICDKCGLSIRDSIHSASAHAEGPKAK